MRLICFIIFLIALNANAASTFFVATNGNDGTGDGSAGNPWLTISHGVGELAAGDTLYVRQGTYRETVTIPTSGTEANRITIAGYSNEIVRLHGSEFLTDWTQETEGGLGGHTNWEKIYYTDVDTNTFSILLANIGEDMRPTKSSSPIYIYLDGGIWCWQMSRFRRTLRPQNSWIPTAWYTNAGWTGDFRLQDTVNLTQDSNYWVGARLMLYDFIGDKNETHVITNQYAGTNTIQTKGFASGFMDDWMVNTNTGVYDRYQIWASPRTLEYTNEYAFDTYNHDFRLWMMLDSHPTNHTIEIPARTKGFILSHKDYITISNFHVQKFYSEGIDMDGCKSNIISHMEISYCRGGLGIDLTRDTNCWIHHNFLTNIYGGHSIGGSKDLHIDHEIITDTMVDGITITATMVAGDSDSGGHLIEHVTINNCWKESHPDGMQFIGQVAGNINTNVTFKSCLLFNDGQLIQSDSTSWFTWTNLMAAYAHWGMWSMSAASSPNWNQSNSWYGSTFFDSGSRSMGSGPVALGNIFVSHNIVDAPGSTTATNDGTSDFNQFWDLDGSTKIAHYDVVSHIRSEYVNIPNYSTNALRDSNSFIGNPRFYNAPTNFVGYSSSDYTNNTSTKFYIEDTSRVAVGDYIEWNQNGTIYQVTNESSDGFGAFIEFTPPYDAWPDSSYPDVYYFEAQARCWNWGPSNTNFMWDLRVMDGAWASTNHGGYRVGSDIIISNYLKGDFDGDGTRDIPELYETLVAEPGPIVWLTFEDDWTGTNFITDQSGHGLHAWKFGRGGTNWPGRIEATNTPGSNQVGYCAEFNWYTNDWGGNNKSGDYAGITNVSLLTNLPSATIMCWARYYEIYAEDHGCSSITCDHNATMLSAGWTNVGNWQLGRFYSTPGGIVSTKFWVVTNQPAWDDNTNRLILDFDDYSDPGDTTNWHHYAVVFDNGNVTNYLDGVAQEDGITTGHTNLALTDGWLALGCWQHAGDPDMDGEDDGFPAGGWMHGVVDDVRIYRRVLTVSDIQEIYASSMAEPEESNPAILSISPTSRTLSCLTNTDATATSYTLSNSGDTTQTINYTNTQAGTWFTMSLTNGSVSTETDTNAITFDTRVLAAGSYTGYVTNKGWTNGVFLGSNIFTINLSVTNGVAPPSATNTLQKVTLRGARVTARGGVTFR